jgi:multidrug efflux pump subunit AcrA (membrane-fusion protein)
MRFLRSRWPVVLVVVILLGSSTAWLMARDSTSADTALSATVKKGEFKAVVTTAGELRAKKFVQITVPQNANQADAYQMKIASIVPEGTIVKEGDVVAELDRSTIAAKMAEVSLALQKAQAQYEQAMLDSTLNLSKAREDIKTLEFGVEEKRLAKEQAVYEAPTIKRQAEIDYDKAQRALTQAKVDYKTKTEQAQAKMREVGADFERQKNKLKVVEDVIAAFTIKAPAPGMVIYAKEWNGKKRTIGSMVTTWDPAVATLPDLSQMESMTYVNEIDIRKIVIGQPVTLTLDSDPSKKLTGTVVTVANVGEQRPNTDAKVFEVKITISGSDTTLRPGMTTSNAVETFKIQNALYVPLEAVSGDSGLSVVYKRAGGHIVKAEVETGAMNDDEVVILRGIAENDKVLLVPPVDRDKFAIEHLPGSSTKPKSVGGDTAVHPTLPATGADSAKKAPAPAGTQPPAAGKAGGTKAVPAPATKG